MTNWAVLVVRDGGRPTFSGPEDPEMWGLVEGFRQKCENAGMTAPKGRPRLRPTPPLTPHSPNDPSRTAALRQIKETIGFIANPRPPFILVLLHNRDNYIYPGIKRLCDVELGIATVCMQLPKVLGQQSQKQDQYFSNVALKVNTKLGGFNHLLDEKDLKWLRDKKTMVMGADVTHPGPTSMEGTPSIAAVVASVDSYFTQYPASLSLQETKQEVSLVS